MMETEDMGKKTMTEEMETAAAPEEAQQQETVDGENVATENGDAANSGDATEKTGFFQKLKDKMGMSGEKGEKSEKGEKGEKEEEPPKPEEPKEPTLEEKLAESEAKVAELNDRLLRCRAEFDNYRKRMAREYAENRESAKINTISEFLNVYDYFMMAMDHAAHSNDLEPLKQGMDMILNEFKRTLGNLGVAEIPAVNCPFDAKLHEAVAQEASETVEEGVIIRQWKPGFKVGDHLLRPATVVVSSGKPKAEPEAAESTDQPEATAAGDGPKAE
jgi:molecular chaperone GrpE